MQGSRDWWWRIGRDVHAHGTGGGGGSTLPCLSGGGPIRYDGGKIWSL